MSATANAGGPAASFGRNGIRRAGSTYAAAAAENLQLEAHLGRNDAVAAAGWRKKSLEARALRSYEAFDLHGEMKQARRVQGLARDRVGFNKRHPEVASLAVGEMGPPTV